MSVIDFIKTQKLSEELLGMFREHGNKLTVDLPAAIDRAMVVLKSAADVAEALEKHKPLEAAANAVKYLEKIAVDVIDVVDICSKGVQGVAIELQRVAEDLRAVRAELVEMKETTRAFRDEVLRSNLSKTRE